MITIMINEDYVSFETAKLLKEKGFMDGAMVKFFASGYDKNGHILSIYETERDDFPRPTHQMAMKWLREVYKIFIQINIVPHTTVTMEQRYYFFTIHRKRKPVYGYIMVDYYSTYEETCEAAIKYCLENLI